jgi:glycosyltransferase involved in cell wall biosynthesis
MESDLVVPITVLMTVHDPPAAMLEQAIDSILGQTFSEFEFLILDDGSQCHDVRSCLARRAAEDSRVQISWELHRGISVTANLGLKRARGEFIARQDADDWSEPPRLERQLSFLRANPEIGLCGSNAWRHQQDGTPLWRSRLPLTHDAIVRAFWTGNPFVHGSTMFERKAALAIGGYREEFPCSIDYDFLWRLAETRCVANLPDALYHYRYVPSAISAVRAAVQARGYQAARTLAAARRIGAREDLDAAFDSADARTTQVLLKQADHLMLAGDYRGAWRMYATSVRSEPASVMAWAKILRCFAFVTFPPAREALFR